MNDIETIEEKPEIVAAKKVASSLEKRVETLTVDSAVSANVAASLLTDIKTQSRSFESQRLFFTKPLNDQVTRINALFKGFTTPLIQLQAKVSQKIISYQKEQEEIRLAEQKKAEQETKRLQKQLDKQAEKEGTEAPKINAPVIAPVETKMENVSVRKTWTFSVKNLDSVPREYMMLDEKKVREAIRQEVRDIRGLEIYQETGLATRI